MRFYFDTYWRMWVRRLLVLQGQDTVYFDLSLTDWDDVEPCIRVHRTANSNKMMSEHLPADVMDEMVMGWGPQLTEEMLNRNYIKEIGIERILEEHKENKEGGGVPLSKLR